MARNHIHLDDIVADIMLLVNDETYLNNTAESTIRNLALRGIRDIGFDMMKRVKSLKLNIDTTNNTVPLPDDFVDLIKIGVVGGDGIVRVIGENKHINMSQVYETDSDGDTFDSDGDGVRDLVDSKSATGSTSNIGDPLGETMDSYIFRNYIYQGSSGRLYGFGGGHHGAQYRLNHDQDRIEMLPGHGINQVVIEYVCDEARSLNPHVHVYAEEAIRSYVYYKLIDKKSIVPISEKQRARAEYYNERRLANSRMKSFSKEDALTVIRKNYRQSPKF